jgi:hypothetical protein
MNIFRHGHDAWGQPVVNGLSWDLLGLAAGVGVAVIVVHFIFRAFSRKRGHEGGE